jgi:NADH-quinone oxidoreductase subunit L
VTWVLLIPLLPALAFAVMLPVSRRTRTSLRWLPLAATSTSLLLSVAAFVRVATHAGGQPTYAASATIAHLGEQTLSVGVRVDPVTAVMLLIVTIVATCVEVYSSVYMRTEERRGDRKSVV